MHICLHLCSSTLVSIAVWIYFNRLQDTWAKLFRTWNFLSAAFFAISLKGPLIIDISCRFWFGYNLVNIVPYSWYFNCKNSFNSNNDCFFCFILLYAQFMSILVFVFNEIFHKIIELGILITVFHILYIYINRDACIYRINTDNGGFKDIYTRVKSILAVRKYFLV